MGSIGRVSRLISATSRTVASPWETQTAPARAVWSMQTRGMAGGHHGDHDGVTYAGLTLHKPASWQTNVGKGFCAVMWFWIFYRFYHDYDTFLFGHASHFEHEDHEEGHGRKHH